jgi:hypothetical protein
MRTSVRDLAGLGLRSFRRALDSRNATVALATATELDFVSLPAALVLLLVDDPGRFRRAALRWHARYCAEVPDVGFEEAHAVARVPGQQLKERGYWALKLPALKTGLSPRCFGGSWRP